MRKGAFFRSEILSCLFVSSVSDVLLIIWTEARQPETHRDKIIQWGRIIKRFTTVTFSFFLSCEVICSSFRATSGLQPSAHVNENANMVIPRRYKTYPGHCLKMIVWIWICIMLALFHQHSWDLHNRVLQRSPQLGLVIFHSKLVFWKKEEKTNIVKTEKMCFSWFHIFITVHCVILLCFMFQQIKKWIKTWNGAKTLQTVFF